jgi:hypothetical protein
MKKGKKLLIIAAIILSMMVAIIVYKNYSRNSNQLHTLESILTYAEQKGTDYAEDRLDYLITYSYKKNELHKAWGAPTDKLLNDNTDADVWLLSTIQHLVVYYDETEEVTKVKILTVTALD